MKLIVNAKERKSYFLISTLFWHFPPQNRTDVNCWLSTSDPFSQNTARSGGVSTTFCLGDQGLEHEGYEKYRLKSLFSFSKF